MPNQDIIAPAPLLCSALEYVERFADDSDAPEDSDSRSTAGALRDLLASPTPAPASDYLALTNDNRTIILRTTAETWAARCKGLGLRPGTQKRQHQLEAFLQGALAVLTCTRVMNHDAAGRVAFMVAIGRGEEEIARWALLRTEAEAAEDVRARAAALNQG